MADGSMTPAEFAERLYDRILTDTNADPDISERTVAIRVIGSAIDQFYRRVDGLLAANNSEVERRREAETEIDRLRGLLRAAHIVPRATDCTSRVFNLVDQAPAEISAADVASALAGVPAKSISNSLAYLVRNGRIAKLGYGKYGSMNRARDDARRELGQ